MRKLFVKEYTCEKAKKLLDSMLDGELTAKQERELSAHLSVCENCRKELEMRRQIQTAMRAEAQTVPFSLHDSLMHRVSKEKQSSSIPHLPRPVATLAGAVCVFALVAGVMLSPFLDVVMKGGITLEDAVANAAPEASSPNDLNTKDEAATDKDCTESTVVQVYTLQDSTVTLTLTEDGVAHITDENGGRFEGQYEKNDDALTVFFDSNKAIFEITENSLILKEGKLFD